MARICSEGKKIGNATRLTPEPASITRSYDWLEIPVRLTTRSRSGEEGSRFDEVIS